MQYAYRVTEDFGVEDAPEEFGTELLDRHPVKGEVILLHWLSGDDAYKVKVLSVDQENLHITVTSAKVDQKEH